MRREGWVGVLLVGLLQMTNTHIQSNCENTFHKKEIVYVDNHRSGADPQVAEPTRILVQYIWFSASNDTNVVICSTTGERMSLWRCRR